MSKPERGPCALLLTGLAMACEPLPEPGFAVAEMPLPGLHQRVPERGPC